MGIIRNTPFITALLLVCIAISFSSNARSQCGGILIEDYDYASMISLKSPDIPTCIINILPRIIIEYADFGSKVEINLETPPINVLNGIPERVTVEDVDSAVKIDLETPPNLSKIANYTLIKVVIEYADYAQAYELRKTPLAPLVPPLGSRVIVEYVDLVSFWDLSLKPVLPDYSSPIIENVRQEPPAEEVYPWDEVIVYANIIDDLSGVRRAILRYTMNDEEWADIEMNNLKEDIYSAVIPKSAPDRNVTYVIIAEDYGSNIAITAEHKYRVLPISSINIEVKPISFIISPGEYITLWVKLTDRSGKPLSKKTIQWIILSDPELPEFPITISSMTNEFGMTAVTYKAVEVPYETQVEFRISFGDSEDYTVSKGKITPPIIIPLMICIVPLIFILIFMAKKSRKSFSVKKKALSGFLLFLSSFLLFYPFKFHEDFLFFILFTKTPFWLNILFLLLFAISILFTIFSKSLKLGLILGICCWSGVMSGLVLPYPHLPSQNFLLDLLFAAKSRSSMVMLSGILSGVLITYALNSLISLGLKHKSSIQPPSPPGPISPLPPSPPPIQPPPKPQLPSIIQPEDYVKCFQNRQYIFDQEIRNGKVEEDNLLGIPRVISGNFGCVFKVECGNKTYAVKCWTRLREDLQRRYKEISNYLKKVNLPYFITFDYVDKGLMLLNGQVVPILKMEWVKGKRLDTFIEENINNSNVLKSLAEKFINCIIDLQKKKIAHGDLCPENIIIVPLTTKAGKIDFKIVLIDYDCLYIPAFSGEEAPELGHDNYQHPKRSKNHYNERLDNFAALIIYLSLLALSSEPDLWDKYHEEEKYLLIKRTDLENPQDSEVIKCLKNSKSSKVRRLTQILLKALNEDPLSEKISPERIK